jgi:alpha-galactosidase
VRCEEQVERWAAQAKEYAQSNEIEVMESHEYASEIMNSAWTGTPSVIYGNVRNNGLIPNLPAECAVEVPCLVDRNGIQPTKVPPLPPQLAALIQTNLNVQSLTVAALMEENREHIYHAAMMDPHTAAELDLDQIWELVDDLLEAHGDWMPEWARGPRRKKVA